MAERWRYAERNHPPYCTCVNCKGDRSRPRSNQPSDRLRSILQTWRSRHFDPHFILGVPTDASRKLIVEAHRRWIVAYHPDKHQNDPLATELTKRLNAARDELLGKGRHGSQSQRAKRQRQHEERRQQQEEAERRRQEEEREQRARETERQRRKQDRQRAREAERRRQNEERRQRANKAEQQRRQEEARIPRETTKARRMPESVPAPIKRPVCAKCQGTGYQRVWRKGQSVKNERCIGCRGSGFRSTSRMKTFVWRTLTLTMAIAIAGYWALSVTSPETIDGLMNSWSGLFDEMLDR